MHDPAIEVEAGHLGELDAHVLRPAQDVPQRRRDLTGREDAGRDLVQQRLEQVVVAPVDQRDVDRQLSEEPARRQATEAAADDDDAMPGVARRARREPADRVRCARRRPGCRSRRRRARALLRRFSCRVEVDRRGDEREMRERLREVAELLTGLSPISSAKSPRWFAVREHLLEHQAGVVEPTCPCECVDVPERAHRERALGAAESVG